MRSKREKTVRIMWIGEERREWEEYSSERVSPFTHDKANLSKKANTSFAILHSIPSNPKQFCGNSGCIFLDLCLKIRYRLASRRN